MECTVGARSSAPGTLGVDRSAGRAVALPYFLALGRIGIYAYPLLFLAIPIYAIFWSGRYRPPFSATPPKPPPPWR